MPAVLFRLCVLGLSGVFSLGVVIAPSLLSPLVDGPNAGVTLTSVSSIWFVPSCVDTVGSVATGLVTASEEVSRRLSRGADGASSTVKIDSATVALFVGLLWELFCKSSAWVAGTLPL